MHFLAFILLALIAGSTEASAAKSAPATASVVNPALQQVGDIAVTKTPTGVLPNIHVAANAPLTVEFLITEEALGRRGDLLSDVDGFLIIHHSADDYKTDLAGNSGDWIACAAIPPASRPKQQAPSKG